jgi:hypothetical protein
MIRITWKTESIPLWTAQSISLICPLYIFNHVHEGEIMKRGNDSWDKPWLAIAAIVGLIVVVIIVLVFFGSGGNPALQSTAGKVTPATIRPDASPTSSGPVISIKQPTLVTIPATGVYVKVSYIGSFSGTYGVDGVMEKARDSGERLYAVDTNSGNVSALFRKEDGSTRHEISVGIYKDGRALRSANSSAPYGEVNVTYYV